MRIQEKTLRSIVADSLNMATGLAAGRTFFAIPAMREDYFLLLANAKGEVAEAVYVPTQKSHISAANKHHPTGEDLQDADNYLTALNSIESIIKGQVPDSELPEGHTIAGYSLATPLFSDFMKQLPFLTHLRQITGKPMQTLFLECVLPFANEANMAILGLTCADDEKFRQEYISGIRQYDQKTQDSHKQTGKENFEELIYPGLYERLNAAGLLERPQERTANEIITLFVNEYVRRYMSNMPFLVSAFNDRGASEPVEIIAAQ